MPNLRVLRTAERELAASAWTAVNTFCGERLCLEELPLIKEIRRASIKQAIQRETKGSLVTEASIVVIRGILSARVGCKTRVDLSGQVEYLPPFYQMTQQEYDQFATSKICDRSVGNQVLRIRTGQDRQSRVNARKVSCSRVTGI